jgi:hypothetical protein
MNEILTTKQVAAMLKLNSWQVYEENNQLKVKLERAVVPVGDFPA